MRINVSVRAFVCGVFLLNDCHVLPEEFLPQFITTSDLEKTDVPNINSISFEFLFENTAILSLISRTISLYPFFKRFQRCGKSPGPAPIMSVVFCVVLVFMSFLNLAILAWIKPFFGRCFGERKKRIWQNKKKYFNSLCNEYLFSFLRRFSDDVWNDSDLPIWEGNDDALKQQNNIDNNLPPGNGVFYFSKLCQSISNKHLRHPIPEIPDTENIVDRLEHQENNRYGAVFQISLQNNNNMFRSFGENWWNPKSNFNDWRFCYKIPIAWAMLSLSVESYSISCFCKCAIWARAESSHQNSRKMEGLWKNILQNEVALSQ